MDGAGGVPAQLSRAGVRFERTYISMFNLITNGSLLYTELDRLSKTRQGGLDPLLKPGVFNDKCMKVVSSYRA